MLEVLPNYHYSTHNQDLSELILLLFSDLQYPLYAHKISLFRSSKATIHRYLLQWGTRVTDAYRSKSRRGDVRRDVRRYRQSDRITTTMPSSCRAESEKKKKKGKKEVFLERTNYPDYGSFWTPAARTGKSSSTSGTRERESNDSFTAPQKAMVGLMIFTPLVAGLLSNRNVVHPISNLSYWFMLTPSTPRSFTTGLGICQMYT